MRAMAEIRNRGSVLATEEGIQILQDAKAAKRNYNGKPWTYRDIEIESGISEKTIGRFFRREQAIDELSARAICQALGVEFTSVVETHLSAEIPKDQSQKQENGWQDICRGMLPIKLDANPLFSGDGVTLGIEDIVPLDLVERKERPKPTRDLSPENSQQALEEQEIPLPYNQFFDRVLIGCRSLNQQGKGVAIIGEPGAGKTTLLCAIADWIMKQGELPIFISLQDLEAGLEPYVLETWLRNAIRKRKAPEQLQDDLIEQCNAGRVWLLLDGVDEMVQSNQSLSILAKEFRGWVGDARIVLTCRVNVWEANKNELRAKFEIYRSRGFRDEEQLIFIQNFFQKAKQVETGSKLIDKLKNAPPRLKDLLKSPLWITLLCRTWKRRQGALPATKAELYESFTKTFYDWKDIPYVPEEKRPLLERALGELAKNAIDREDFRFRLRETFIRQELDKFDTSFFGIACELGWINKLGCAVENPDELVYAFLHPTFQEYFAALAIDDWHDFLNHIPENPNHSDAKYRIFESRWQEVITLWVGRKDKKISQQQKEQFITELTEFEDISGKYGFYSRQAYLVAARGIGQYESSKVYEIANQIVKWSFGYFDSAQQQWMQFAYYLQQEAKSALLESHHQAVVQALVLLLPTVQHEFIILDVIGYLWKIDPGNSLVFNILEKLTNPEQDKFVFQYAAEFWWDIEPGNETLLKKIINVDAQDELGFRKFRVKLEEFDKDIGIRFFTELTKSARTPENRFDAAVRLLKLDSNNLTAVSALMEIFQAANIDEPGSITLSDAAAWQIEKFGGSNSSLLLTLEKLIKNSKEELIRGKAAISLARINPENEIALKTLDCLIHKSQNAWIRWHIAKCLGELFPHHRLAIETLKELAQTIRVDSARLSIAQDLWKIAPNNSITASVLVDLIRSTQDDFTRSIAIDYLTKIDCSQTTALLEEVAQSVQSEFIRWRVIHELSKLAPENDLVQPILEQLAQSAKTSRTRYHAADSLLNLYPGNKPAIKTLIELIKSSNQSNDDIDTQTPTYLANASDKAADRLIQSFKDINISDIVVSLKILLVDKILENDIEKFIRCHSIIGRCAQNMSYPEFYQAFR